jgi:hypothetical protein
MLGTSIFDNRYTTIWEELEENRITDRHQNRLPNPLACPKTFPKIPKTHIIPIKYLTITPKTLTTSPIVSYFKPKFKPPTKPITIFLFHVQNVNYFLLFSI